MTDPWKTNPNPRTERDAKYWRIYADAVRQVRRMVNANYDLLTPAGWMCQRIVLDLFADDAVGIDNRMHILETLHEVDRYQHREIDAKRARELLDEVIRWMESIIPPGAMVDPGQRTLNAYQDGA